MPTFRLNLRTIPPDEQPARIARFLEQFIEDVHADSQRELHTDMLLAGVDPDEIDEALAFGDARLADARPQILEQLTATITPDHGSQR